MKIIYILILLLLSIFIVINMFEEEDKFKQINCVLVLVPFILRMLMIK